MGIEINLKETKIPIQIGVSKYYLGTKMFPFNSRRVKIFNNEVTNDISLPSDFYSLVDGMEWESGFCYSNAAKVQRVLHHLGILEAEFYAGWVSILGNLPLHHAWVVLGDSVIDMSIDMREMAFLKTVVPEEGVDWRAKVLPDLKKIRLSKRPSVSCVIGKLPEGYVYVGCRDTIDGARKKFNEIKKTIPNHPCYTHREFNNGPSKLQEMLWEEEDSQGG